MNSFIILIDGLYIFTYNYTNLIDRLLLREAEGLGPSKPGNRQFGTSKVKRC